MEALKILKGMSKLCTQLCHFNLFHRFLILFHIQDMEYEIIKTYWNNKQAVKYRRTLEWGGGVCSKRDLPTGLIEGI